ncbi:uncharacterized protein CANTADRAFT_19685 [Suhomyces tanzawaensis NRRL Y-17324]|uniref:Mitochondrial distribution and morphology protein 12 n=1 Tax=Suhomyces tanzawaensis NRRL Y-17324 TaxID=984487 RepID=A0A1E4SRG1_9ASCO|nr:uncharacterized protein CANTADRAFT_19685 [Suhomyces tanzawaensis NRRL Y-17324]ODV82100.1 hypothetical protein CANTADRAFT_19685 [Suhomyces tanzawaensis NRRL Y-17324]
MSFEIDWNKLTEDNSINESIKEFLDSQFSNIELPSFVSHLSVTDFSLGDQPPEVVIRHIGDPFEDFYEDEEDEKEAEKSRTPMDEEEEEEEEARRPVREDEDDEDDEDEDEDQNNDMASLTQGMNSVKLGEEHDESQTSSSAPPALERLRTSLDSISLMLGNNTLNYLQNYNMNHILGLGPNSNSNGTETPTDLLNQSSLRINSLRNQFAHHSAPEVPKITGGTKSKLRSADDLQLIVEIKYSGNMHIQLSVNLLVNYPSPNFITLPIKLHITELNIHSVASIAYLKKAVYFSFLCDLNDASSDYFSTTTSTGTHADHTPTYGANFVDYSTGPNNRERIDIIKKVRIESEIGEVEHNVLRNVGKVEKFLIDQLRGILRDEIAWPSWVCFDLSGEDEDTQEEDE